MIYIVGHKNPDSDSVTSAIALSNLKNKIGYDTVPCILGEINRETEYILDYFDVECPKKIENVKTQIKDLDYEKIQGVKPNDSIYFAYNMMEKENIRMIPIVHKDNKLLGITTMKDIAMELIAGDIYHLKTSLTNIIRDLNGVALVNNSNEIEGKISVISLYHNTVVKNDILNKNSIVIVGDRYDIIEHAIEIKVKAIIITGGKVIPEKYIKKAKENEVTMIMVDGDTYTVSKHINYCNYVSSIMKDSGMIKFVENEYLDEIKEELTNNRNSYYPVVTDDNKLLGLISRRHILKPNRKKVVLVDHNEYSQSVEGLNDAQILEIIDHHKIGDISTSDPISFRNIPVGSTCTIVFNMYKEYNIDIDKKTAGLIIAGIISDTLLLQSPTTTDIDRKAVGELNKKLNLDIDTFAMDMFKAGSSLEGQSIQEIFYKDFKEFNIEGNSIGLGQVFTLDIEDILNREDEFIDYMRDLHENKDYFMTILLITDILKNGSYILFHSNNNSVISIAFEKNGYQGMFLENIVSRKKQVVPKLIEAIKMI